MAINTQCFEITVGKLEEKIRLDSYLSQQGLKRSVLSGKDTVILLNGNPAKKGKPVKTNDRITVTYTEEIFAGLSAQDIPLNVLYEDDELLVINKEQGMVVHPALGNHEGTVVNGLLGRYGMDFCTIFSQDPTGALEAGAVEVDGDTEDDGDTPEEKERYRKREKNKESETETERESISIDSVLIRPGIVHRLDKDSSGTLVIARTLSSYRSLSAQFKAHTTKKTYIALAKGNFSRVEGSIQTNIKRDSRNRKRFVSCSGEEGRTALTHYRVLRQFPSYALVRINIHTGRTHQIRVHLQSLGHPLVGDVIYGKEDGTSLMLHALELGFDHPSSGERLTFRSPLPSRFLQYVRRGHK